MRGRQDVSTASGVPAGAQHTGPKSGDGEGGLGQKPRSDWLTGTWAPTQEGGWMRWKLVGVLL